MTNTTPEQQPPSGPVINQETGQVAPSGATPKKYFRELIRERREQVRSLLAKGILSTAKIAATLGVSEETARQDVKAVRKEDQEKFTKKASLGHMSDMIAQLDEVIAHSSADLYLLKDQNTPRAVHVRSALNQTKLRAIALKAQLLMQTSVIPSDITNVEKIVEGELAEARVKDALDPSLAKVVQNIESRRKVLDVLEKLKGASPEAQEAAISALEQLTPEEPRTGSA
jgi:hypothetical protein